MMNNGRNTNSTRAITWSEMHTRMCIQNIPLNGTTICSISLPKSLLLYCIYLIKGKYYHSSLSFSSQEVVISVSLNICVINCKWAGQNFGWRIDHTMELILIRCYGNLNNMVFCGLLQRRDQWRGTIGADSHEGMVLSFLSQRQVKQS